MQMRDTADIAGIRIVPGDNTALAPIFTLSPTSAPNLVTPVASF